MLILEKTLPDNDLGYLRIVAAFWGVELISTEPAKAVAELASALCDAELLEEIISTLPDDAQTALGALVDASGRLPWDVFIRRFGELREMGPGKRDREKPHLKPISAAEILWYRALVARAFFETEKGLQEFAFIPADLFEALEFIGFKSAGASFETEEPEPVIRAVAVDEDAVDVVDINESWSADFESEPDPPLMRTAEALKATPRKAVSEDIGDKPLGRPATPAEKSISQLASDRLLDDVTTLLAALRTEREIPALDVHRPFVLGLLTASRFISSTQTEADPGTENWILNPETLKTFFETPRLDVLTRLADAWRNSPEINDLRQLPGLVCEGGWRNDSLETRAFLLDQLALVPRGQWWSLTAFIRDLKSAHPDFQRQGGEYDTWFIKRQADGLYLRGFAHWDDVEGALLRYFVQIFHWLGLADLARAQDDGPISAFRLRDKADIREENDKINVKSNGRISAPRLTPRSVRYQVARFCEWEEGKPGGDFCYRVTPDSLKAAHAQGLKASQLLSLLAKNAAGPIPPTFVKALQRWEVNGTEARVEQLVVLRVSRPEVMSELKNSKAGRFLSEPLGPTAAVVKSGAESKILEALAEMGLLAEVSGMKSE